MGLGLLVTLVAFMIVAAVAAGTVLVSSTELRSSAMGIFNSGSKGLASFMQVIMIDADDGTLNGLNNFTLMARLIPGSNPINLNNSLFVFKNREDIALLRFNPHRENANVTNDATGYITHIAQEQGLLLTNQLYGVHADLDEDGHIDYLSLNTTHALFNLSGGGSAFAALNGSEAWGGAGSNISVNTNMVDANGTIYGSIRVSGTVAVLNQFPEAGTFVVTPKKLSRGWFSVEYLEQSNMYRGGYVNDGDVVKFYFESPTEVLRGDEISFGIASAEMEYYVDLPLDVINYDSTERVILYP